MPSVAWHLGGVFKELMHFCGPYVNFGGLMCLVYKTRGVAAHVWLGEVLGCPSYSRYFDAKYVFIIARHCGC